MLVDVSSGERADTGELDEGLRGEGSIEIAGDHSGNEGWCQGFSSGKVGLK